MRSKLTILPVALVAFSFCARAQAPQKFAVVNMQEIILETKDGKQAAADLRAKFAPKQQEFEKRSEELQRLQDELRKTENTISDEKKAALQREIDARTKSLQRDNDDAREDVNQEQQKVLNELGGKIMQVITKFANDKGYTFVFDISGQPNNILFASTSTDITHEVIALYDQTSSSLPTPKPAATTTSAPAPARRPAAPASGSAPAAPPK